MLHATLNGWNGSWDEAKLQLWGLHKLNTLMADLLLLAECQFDGCKKVTCINTVTYYILLLYTGMNVVHVYALQVSHMVK